MEHPHTGTGHPEQLSGDLSGKWSRRITKRHRLIYEIHDNEVVVIAISAYGHYSDCMEDPGAEDHVHKHTGREKDLEELHEVRGVETVLSVDNN